MLFKTKKEFKVDSQLSHIAFIMDGNGRWAKKRGLPRKIGHKYGAKAFEETVKNCHSLGIKTVTVYAFSTENWSRPQEEVDAILNLMRSYIDEAKKYDGVRVIFIGDKSPLPDDIKHLMINLENSTENFSNILNIAFNYGGRAEIVHACNDLIRSGKQSISEDDICNHLYTKISPDPDLIIRTANEFRLSNFLLWQCAYSELYVTKTLWPDFNMKELMKAIKSFYARNRKFGGIND